MPVIRVASPRRNRLGIVLAAIALALSVVPAATAHAAAPDAVPIPQIIPKPASMSVGSGEFTLGSHARIVVDSQPSRAIGRDLAAYLRPATGYPLPVVIDEPHPGDITLSLITASDLGDEGYRLTTTSSAVTLVAGTTHGLFNGVQTIRQLLPAWIESPTTRPGPWTMPVVQITDQPRYAYRGVMLDIARHFEPPSAVKQLIDQASSYKMNVLHLHVSDDQGFRIVINGFPNLTAIGGQGSVGTDGRTMDPGGYWTQDEYRDVVAYAAAHFMTVVPEVDTPGHNNAIIMSEYNDTANPLLNGHPQDINCGLNNPPVWNYTGAVGYSALCPESDNTWTILSTIIDQLTAMSPGPYYDLGGDEVPSTVLDQTRYAALVNREAGIVNSHGKIAMGWADIAGSGTSLAPGSVAEYWNPASGSSPSTATATEAVAKGMKIVMSPANHAYLDQKYARGVPANLGLTWACNQGCDVDQFYNWDPGSYVTGVTDDDVIGIEGAMWAETVRTMSEVDYMVLPRLLALAELGWSPKVERTLTSPAYQDFLARLAAQGTRFTAAGTNFYPSTQVPWHVDLVGGDASVGPDGVVTGSLATAAAPGYPASVLTATIDWGDGTTSAGTLTGTAATGTTVNGAYSVSGEHTYAARGAHEATITVTAPNSPPASITVTLR